MTSTASGSTFFTDLAKSFAGVVFSLTQINQPVSILTQFRAGASTRSHIVSALEKPKNTVLSAIDYINAASDNDHKPESDKNKGKEPLPVLEGDFKSYFSGLNLDNPIVQQELVVLTDAGYSAVNSFWFAFPYNNGVSGYFFVFCKDEAERSNINQNKAAIAEKIMA